MKQRAKLRVFGNAFPQIFLITFLPKIVSGGKRRRSGRMAGLLYSGLMIHYTRRHHHHRSMA